MTESQTLLYHEKQVAALCGQHCLNSLLQGPYFTEIDLSQIAQELDAIEQSFMAESGMDTKEYKAWQSEASGNVAEDGMFSIQVLSRALQNWNLTCTSLYSPECIESLQHPENEDAFICNLQEHWLTIRRIGDSFYNFNSLYPAPEYLGMLYLSAFLATLKEKGYSIFVVKGAFPRGQFEASECPGRWFTPDEAKVATKQAVDARESGYVKAALGSIFDKASKAGSVLSLKPARESAWTRKRQWEPEVLSDGDDDMAQAIAASLGHEPGQGPSVREEDPEMAAALAASLADPQPSSIETLPPTSCTAEVASTDPGQEPSAGPGVLGIAFKLYNGDRLTRRFKETDLVSSLHSFLHWNGVGDVHQLRLFPNKVLASGEETLQAAGISNMETITVTRKL